MEQVVFPVSFQTGLICTLIVQIPRESGLGRVVLLLFTFTVFLHCNWLLLLLVRLCFHCHTFPSVVNILCLCFPHLASRISSTHLSKTIFVSDLHERPLFKKQKNKKNYYFKLEPFLLIFLYKMNCKQTGESD